MRFRSSLTGPSVLLALSLCACAALADESTGKVVPPPAATSNNSEAAAQYVLGPQDTLLIRVANEEDITSETPYAIDLDGNLAMPRIGMVHASGLTVEQLQRELTKRYGEFLQDPMVVVSVAEYHSQPISVLGAVENPGIRQIRGRKTLFEVLSEAGGLSQEAGTSIHITRKKSEGTIPLPNAAPDGSGDFTTAEVNIRAIMDAKDPHQNIAVKPFDVITVPKADLIYVVGAVNKPGGFVLSERPTMSVLQALSLAQGASRTAATSRARILRHESGSPNPIEITVDVKGILEGKKPDAQLTANDILFIPNSAAKSVSLRTLEALVSTGSGLLIYRP